MTGRSAFLLVLLLAAAPAHAQMAICATKQTQADMNACADAAYKKDDAAMNQVYDQLTARLTDTQVKAQLVDAERAWIAYRDKFCAFQASGTAGGSIHPLIVSQCLDEKTAVHSAELSRQLNCKEGDPSCVH
jgi:uncharacterized protein YecT (DUF1311 family)